MANVFLTVVVPVIGNILGAIMLLSPVKAVLEVRRNADIGDINALPFSMTAINCLGWVCYGIVISNGYILPANILGLVAGVVFTLVTLPYVQPQKMQDIIIGMTTFTALHFSILGTITSLVKMSFETAQSMWGINAVIILFAYYGAPLSSLAQVLRTKNAASIYLPLAVAALANGSLWTIYGLVIKDINIWLPNLFGSVIGIIQVGFRFRYGVRIEPKLSPSHDYLSPGNGAAGPRISASGLLRDPVHSHPHSTYPSHVVNMNGTAGDDHAPAVATKALGNSSGSVGIQGMKQAHGMS